ncbi:MAG: efflux transporter outer membrane subunit [Sulfitobacter sp.]
MIKSVSAIFAVALCVAGCDAVGPDFRRPDIPLQTSFSFQGKDALEDAARAQWWKGLDDPVLDELMARALSQNLELKVAVARIEQARAQLRSSGTLTQLSGSVSGQAYVGASGGRSSDTVIIEAEPVFVLDLFGENRRRREAAAAGVNTAVFEAAAAQLALQLQLVNSYSDLRYFQALERLRQRSIANEIEVVSAVRRRENLQHESKLTLRRAEAELQLKRADVPASQQGQIEAILGISTLLAQPYEEMQKTLSRRRAQPHPPQNISPGVPAALLKNRPDVRAAEAAFAAAVAQVGVAEAQLYPSLRLNGQLTATQGGALSFGPTLSVPVFGRAARVAGKDLAVARALEAELMWRDTVLVSIEEVQLGLAELNNTDKQVAALNNAASKFRDVAELSMEAFRLQAITFVDVLDVEDSLTQSELQLINAKWSNARAWARLNVAIGLGWQNIDGEY